MIAVEFLPNAVAVVVWLGVVAYAVLGGADYGAGSWDLLAGTGEAAPDRRHRIDRSLGPVWEANHVWLIFVLVFLWTGFPTAFAAIATGLMVPLLLAGAGIVYRGGSFVFRKSASTFGAARLHGAVFAGSSLVTPFFLGAVAGAIASGRVAPDGRGPAWSSWTHPVSILGGVLAVGTCAWLAAVFLASDADRDDETDLATYFGRRALVSGVIVGIVALVGVLVVRSDAPTLASGLEGRSAAFIVTSALGGLSAMWLLAVGRFRAARIPAVAAVVSVVVGWGVGQYPDVLGGRLTLGKAAAPSATLAALLVTFAVAAALVLPALAWLLLLSNRGSLEDEGIDVDSSAARLESSRPTPHVDILL